MTDTSVTGTEYVLNGFDASTLTISGANRKGSFSAPYNTGTVFRNAQVDKYLPGDPCRTFASDYNTAGLAGDSTGLNAALTNMATNGCHARVLVDSKLNTIKSFAPSRRSDERVAPSVLPFDTSGQALPQDERALRGDRCGGLLGVSGRDPASVEKPSVPHRGEYGVRHHAVAGVVRVDAVVGDVLVALASEERVDIH